MLQRAGSALIDMDVAHDLVALLLGAIVAVGTTAGSAWTVARMRHRDPDELPGLVNVLCLLVGLGVGLGIWWVTSR
jgi:hypothetical protein